jgi:adenylate cyclase, class 2
MSFEVEKKYRLTAEQREHVLRTLAEVGAEYEGEDFEENILYSGGMLSLKRSILRLRRTERKAVLTYKESQHSDSSVKCRLEHETEVKDADELHHILESLGYASALVYEKRRKTWQYKTVEIVVDELPFGFYLEIEGAEEEILAAENELNLQDLTDEPQPYPSLAAQLGEKRGAMIEARFASKKD